MYARACLPIATAVATSLVAFAAHAADPLPRAKPESVGMSSARLAHVGEVLRSEVDKGKFPGAVVAVARKGKLVYYEAIGRAGQERDPLMRVPENVTADVVARLQTLLD